MTRRLGLVAAFILSVSPLACSGDTSDPAPLADGDVPGSIGGGEKGGVTIGPDGVPVGPDGKPITPKLDGRYELSTEFDITSMGIFPETVSDTLSALSNFREKPSQTLVDLLDVANVPVVPNLLNAIPGPIRGYVLGWVDDHVFKALFNKVPVTKNITGILDDLASIVTRFELVSTYDLAPPGSLGDAKSWHQASGVAYHWSEKRHVIKAPELLQTASAQSMESNAVLLDKLHKDLESGRLEVGKHTFPLPFGSLAVIGADYLAKEKFGATDLRDAIGKVVNCPALAKAVASKCIDPFGPGKVCVGHETELAGFCTVGLDVLVSVVRNQIKRLDIPFLELRHGTAQLWDAAEPNGPLDARVDRIEKGYWQAFVKADGSDRAILATFSGRRVGDAVLR